MILNNLSDSDILENVNNIIQLYSSKIKDWKVNIKIDGKNIEKVNIEQVAWLAYYDELRVEVKALVDFFDMHVSKVRGKLYQKITSESNFDLSDRAKDKLIDCAQEYMDIYRNFLNIKEVYDTLNSITDQFKGRAYAINNIVKIRTESLQDETLFYEN